MASWRREGGGEDGSRTHSPERNGPSSSSERADWAFAAASAEGRRGSGRGGGREGVYLGHRAASTYSHRARAALSRPERRARGGALAEPAWRSSFPGTQDGGVRRARLRRPGLTRDGARAGGSRRARWRPAGTRRRSRDGRSRPWSERGGGDGRPGCCDDAVRRDEMQASRPR